MRGWDFSEQGVTVDGMRYTDIRSTDRQATSRKMTSTSSTTMDRARERSGAILSVLVLIDNTTYIGLRQGTVGPSHSE
jgi:hypothetical protein